MFTNTTNILVKLCLLLMAGLIMTSHVNAREIADHTAVQQILEQTVISGNVPGFTVEIYDENGTWFHAAGLADVEARRQHLPKNEFRIGSTTKTFTATVVLQLVGENVLSLEDTVEKWLPGLLQGNNYDGNSITIKQLLQQTSGIFNYVLDPEAMAQFLGPTFLEHRYDVYKPEDLIKLALAHPPDFAPGTDWAYSNTNYILLGMIVERATGKPFAEEIETRIVQPLGLTGTYLPHAPTLRGSHGKFYSKLYSPDSDAQIHDVTELSPSVGWTAGGMVSTVGDLNHFFAALVSGQLLQPKEQQAMFSGVMTKNWIPNTTYGLGISSVKLSCDVTLWGHGGAINGSWSYSYGTRDGKRMVTQHVNGDWSDQIGIFTKVLEAEFCSDGSSVAQ
jgi:D-alanyl-D-alanine carboxypeptidase